MTLDLDAIKTRAEAATKGPWAYDGSYVETVAPFDLHRFDAMSETVARIDLLDEDGEFIAAARTDIPALIAEVERLRGIVDRVRELHPYEVIELHESHGEEAWCPECQFHYPCQTIRAMETE